MKGGKFEFEYERGRKKEDGRRMTKPEKEK